MVQEGSKTAILAVHTDEVWNIEWSHDGAFLASAGKDKSAIIWRMGPETEPSKAREYTPEHILRDHPYAVICLTWSLDDSILLTSSDNFIKLWNTRFGTCAQTLEAHTEAVTALEWLPDDSGFISGSLDRRMIIWDVKGRQRDTLDVTIFRVTDLAISPDYARVIALGMDPLPSSPSATTTDFAQVGDASVSDNDVTNTSMQSHMIVYNLTTKRIELSVPLGGNSTSIKVSQDGRYALMNLAPNMIQLWDISLGQLACKYTGQHQGRHVIRICFGGIDGNLIVSGSEDGNVYVWHRETGGLLEVLSGHGEGTVNSVVWNPKNDDIFASCSDDNTIRIWVAALRARVSTPA